jgi:hypothetical protein
MAEKAEATVCCGVVYEVVKYSEYSMYTVQPFDGRGTKESEMTAVNSEEEQA